MNIFQRAALRVIFPKTHLEHTESEQAIAWYQDRQQCLVDIVNRQAWQLKEQQQQLTTFWGQHELCRDGLLTLVAKNDDGDWTTVFDANEPITPELNDYLSALVART